MNGYIYSLVRCVPDPRTGEFVNVGAIAGDPGTGDWSIRQVSSESRVRKLASAEALGAVHDFMARVGLQIDAVEDELQDDALATLSSEWLDGLYHDHRNVVQLSPPTPIVADDAESALDVLFHRQVIDPVAQPRVLALTKHAVLRDLRLAYSRANVARFLHRKADLFVGDRIHASVDFVIADSIALQISQGWSFQGGQLDALSEQVKAWGYAVRSLRDGEKARVLTTDAWSGAVEPDVDVEVVVAEPRTPRQTDAYLEAAEIFSQLKVSVHSLSDVERVSERADEILASR